MDDLRKAAQAALETLEGHLVPSPAKRHEVIMALCAALAQPQAEPVAWWVPSFSEPLVGIGPKKPMLWPEAQPLYSNQPAEPKQQAEPATVETVPWPKVTSYSGGAWRERGWVDVQLGDGPEVTRLVRADAAQQAEKTCQQCYDEGVRHGTEVERERCAMLCDERRERDLSNNRISHAAAADDCARMIRNGCDQGGTK